MEYIEREAAERAAHMAFVRRNDALQYSEMIHQLAKIPAADVRPVVLCRDCIHEPRWTPVTERLPEVNEIVYIIQTYSWQNFEDAAARTIGRWNGRYWEWIYYRPSFQHGTLMDLGIICPGNEYVTHWRPLPEPPKEE